MKSAVLLLALCLCSPWLKAMRVDSLETEQWGIVNVSVCNLRAEGDFSSEMISQGLLGMPVRILGRDGWLRVQTPDDYVGWVHRVGVYPVTAEELSAWNRAEKVVVCAHYGSVYSQPDVKSQTVSDVVGGNRFRLLGTRRGFYHVAYPDGREGYVSKSVAQTERRWRAALRQDAESIVRTAHTLMGVPYLWAGTSSKGLDCSGFVRTVLFLHDIIMPRDASQQARVGERVEIAPDFSNLHAGDLVFFGRKATSQQTERVVHVAIYIGNRRFIHSQGDVHISSFDPTDPLYDEYNLGRLLFATRFIPYINKAEAINTTETNPYYKE